MTSPRFSIGEAFDRNLGLISHEEQEALLEKRVALAGCGGVGGVHGHTMARLGVGRFTLADPDTFSVANFNRQMGATIETVGRPKARVVAELIQSINPQAEIDVIESAFGAANADRFFSDVDLVIDGIDFFALESRRLLHSEAWQRRVPVLIAGPLGFSSTLHVFAEGGMSFDEYFDLHEGQSRYEQYVHFLLGLAPAALHSPYTDISTADPTSGRGPSSIIGSQMSACVAGAEAVRILLGRGPSLCAPHYMQVDVYRRRLRSRKLWGGNRNPIQRLKKVLLMQYMARTGLDQAFMALKPA